MWLDFDVRDNRRWTFSLEEAFFYGLWTRILFQNVLMMDLFLINTLRLSSQDVNWWTGLVWIACGLLWCFYQTLILTAPIHCRASIAETVMQCYISPNLMKNQTHIHLGWPEDEHIFSKKFIFGWTFALKLQCEILTRMKCHFCLADSMQISVRDGMSDVSQHYAL